MAVELGALKLLIQDAGGNETLAKLRAIDQQATKTGARAVRVPVSAPGAAQVAGQIGGVGTAATNAAKGLAGLKVGIGAVFGGALALGAVQVASGLASAIGDSARAFDDLERANRRLAATSRTTGVALGDLEAVAQRGERQFRLSRATAADLAVEVSRLAAAAGQAGKAGDALEAFLEIGAGRGLTAAQTLTAVRQAVLGLDEGTDKLFNKNPSGLWDEFAKSIGTTAGKLDEAQKKQALLNAALRDGEKSRGEYEKFLQSAAGKSDQFSQSSERAKQALGRLFAGTRSDLNTTGVAFLDWLAQAIDKYRQLDEASDRFWRNIGSRIRNIFPQSAPPGPGGTIDITRTDRDRQRPPRAPITTSAESETMEEKAQRAVAAAAREAIQRRSQEIQALKAIADLQLLQADDLQRLAALERALTQEIERGNISLADRVDRIRDLLTVQDARITGLGGAGAKIPTITPPGPTQTPTVEPGKIRVGKIDPEQIRQEFERVAKESKIGQEMSEAIRREMERERVATEIADTIGSVLANGIAYGFAQGLADGGIGEAFRQLGAQVLAGFGHIMINLGVQAIAASAIMKALAAALASLNPFLLLAAGAGLVALGSALGGRRGGMRSSGSFSRGISSGTDTTRLLVADRGIATRRIESPTGAQGVSSIPAPTTVIVGLLNPNDPASQRLLTQAVRAGERRGL